MAPSQCALLTGIFTYNAIVSMLVVYAGAVLNMSGILLWPTVAFHAILAIWCFKCLIPDGIPADSVW